MDNLYEVLSQHISSDPVPEESMPEQVRALIPRAFHDAIIAAFLPPLSEMHYARMLESAGVDRQQATYEMAAELFPEGMRDAYISFYTHIVDDAIDDGGAYEKLAVTRAEDFLYSLTLSSKQQSLAVARGWVLQRFLMETATRLLHYGSGYAVNNSIFGNEYIPTEFLGDIIPPPSVRATLYNRDVLLIVRGVFCGLMQDNGPQDIVKRFFRDTFKELASCIHDLIPRQQESSNPVSQEIQTMAQMLARRARNIEFYQGA